MNPLYKFYQHAVLPKTTNSRRRYDSEVSYETNVIAPRYVWKSRRLRDRKLRPTATMQTDRGPTTAGI